MLLRSDEWHDLQIHDDLVQLQYIEKNGIIYNYGLLQLNIYVTVII